VARAPETRGLGTALAALYPAGEAVHLAGADPLLVGAFAPPAALAAYVGTHKAHRSHRYSATVAATAAGIPAWLATAAATGITSLPVLVAYTTAAAVTWSAVTWSDVLRHRRAHKAQQAKWETIASAAGLEGSQLIGTEDTRTGQRFRVDVRGTGKTASQLTRGDLAERIAAVLSLPAQRVRVAADASHAGVILITVQMQDPWAAPPATPALDPAYTPARRSVLDGPFVLGTDPDTGNDLTLTIFDRRGGQHTIIVAATGGGKTTLYSNLLEQATLCTDVLVWPIDLGKGTIPAVWEPALDASAGIEEFDKALAILEWAAMVTNERSRASAGRNHQPTPQAPVIFIPIDEMDTLLGPYSPIAHKAKPLVEHLFRRGRSAGVELAIAGQRGTIQHTGSKDPHANAANKIILRVNRAGEMTNVVPGWELAGMPDMAAYAPGVPGVALVVDADSAWRAGRIRDLSDLDKVAELAQRRGRPTATLEAAIAAQLPGYDARHATGATVLTLPGRDSHAPDTGTGGGGGGWGIDPHDADAITHLARDLVAEVESRLAGMPSPPERPVSLADLLAAREAISGAEDNDPAANRAIPVPDRIAAPILGLLAERGDAGARRDEIVAAVGRSRSWVANWLAILRDHGTLTTAGAGKAARYYLPEHAPDADSTTGEDDAEDGNAA
jgi:membrane protein implicated in regulation of membrane protease activity